MLAILILVLAGLAPGVLTAWQVYQRHGWPRAIAAGAGVTIALAGSLLVSLIILAPLAIVLAVASAVAALTAYDRGRIWTATVWVCVMAVCVWCAGWTT